MKLNKAREKLLDMYIQSLKEEKLSWSKGWDIDLSQEQHNPVTNVTYKGVNWLLLNMVANDREYTDPRWATFNQIKDNGWKLEEATGQGVPIEFWSVYDKEAKKTVTIAEYNEAIRLDPDCKDKFKMVDRIYFVFNAKHIKGIPPLEKGKQPHKLKNPSKFIENLIQKMGVGYEEHGNKAYYHPRFDKVVVPDSTQFRSQYEYDATRLHELCHATGHPTRLDRKVANQFGTPDYAKEELRAELTASFLAQDISVAPSQMQLDNHKAYIQSWITSLQDDPNELFRAIKDAEKIYDYVVEKGELEKFIKVEKRIDVAIESTLDYCEPTFHRELIDLDIPNEQGVYGKFSDSYRLVTMSEKGYLMPFDDKVFATYEDAENYAKELKEIELVNYDKLVNLVTERISKNALEKDQNREVTTKKSLEQRIKNAKKSKGSEKNTLRTKKEHIDR